VTESASISLYDDAMANLAVGDLRNARRIMGEAADAQYEQAVSLYASFVEHGIGGRANERKAMIWYAKAARLGNAGACIRLASWHIVNGSLPQAKYWLRKAYGDPRAMLILAGLHERSRSVRATVSAKSALSTVSVHRTQLNPNERAEYERLSAEYRRRKPDPVWSRANQGLPKRSQS
jgi:TPR repeat protein